MAFELALPRQLAKAGWKVKIRDKERLEDPHLTIIKGTRAWRIGLRNGLFLDAGKWKDFPDALRKAIDANWTALCENWDEMYSHNPVTGKDEENHEGQ